MENEELVKSIKQGVETEKNMLQLWENCKNYVHAVARRFYGLAEIDDLLQEGFLSLYDAVELYNPEKGCTFLTYYGSCVTRRMFRYVLNDRLLPIPAPLQSAVLEYERFVSNYEAEYGHSPDIVKTAHYLRISPDEVRRIKRFSEEQRLSSLDSDIAGCDDLTIGDTVAAEDDTEESAVDNVMNDEKKRVLWSIVAFLPNEQQKVISELYIKGITREQAAANLGITASQARRLEYAALYRLAHCKNTQILKSMLYGEIDVYGNGISKTGAKEYAITWTSATERTALKLLEQ